MKIASGNACLVQFQRSCVRPAGLWLRASQHTGGASNTPHNGHYRTRQTRRQRLPQPHQLPTPNTPHRKRSRRLHPHPTMKSRFTTCMNA